MTDELVRYESDQQISVITLNRPDKLNAISPELREALTEALKRADADSATSVVVLRGEGRSFCVGYDIGGGDESAEAWRHDALKWHEHLSEALEFEMMP